MSNTEDFIPEVSEEQQREWQVEFPPKPASSHTALADDEEEDYSHAYEITDPKHPDFLEHLFDRAEAWDARD